MPLTPTILLHLGTHKTGSTSIQRNFARHRAVLRAHGVRFLGPERPYPFLYSAFLPNPMDYIWNRHSGLDRAQIAARDAASLAALERQLAENLTGDTAPWVVVSNEFLAMLPAPRLAALRDRLAPYGQVRAVYAYRDLQGWIASNTQEMAKAGLATQRTPFDPALKRISTFPAKIAEVFGRGSTHFLRFEDAAEVGICSLFLKRFGLPDFPMMGVVESRENVAISAAAVEALFAYNRQHPPGSPGRDPAEVERRKALPGPRYVIDGFSEAEIARYVLAYQVAAGLGLRIAAPEALARRKP